MLQLGLDLVDREGLVADGVHVEVNTAIVMKDKVAYGIGALDRKRVSVPGFQKPRVLGRQKLASSLVGPKLEFKLDAGLFFHRGWWWAVKRTLYSKSEYAFRQLCCDSAHISGIVSFLHVWCRIRGICLE